MATPRSKKQQRKSKHTSSRTLHTAHSRNPRKEMEQLASVKHSKDIEQHINKENSFRNDPENADSGFDDGTMAGSGRRKVDVDEELGDEGNAQLRPGTLRPVDETFEQGKYAGERVNVNSIYSNDQENNDSDVQSEEESSEDEEGGREELPNGSGGSSVGDTASEQDGEQTANQESSRHDGSEEINDELAALEAEDEAQFIQMSKSSHVDKEKGDEVKHQVHFFERLLESRILTQRLVKDANRFPRQDAYQGLVKQDSKLGQNFHQCASALKKTLAQCLELQTLSLPSTDSVKQNCKSRNLDFDDLGAKIVPGRKRRREDDDSSEGEDQDEETDDQSQIASVDSDAIWSALDTLHQVSMEPMKGVLDREYERVNQGKGRNKAMKALYQPISKQVDEILADTERFQRRAHIRLSNSSVLGEDQAKFQSATASQEWDKEVYDDSEFYQMLLKEFLQSKSTDDAMAAQSSVSGNLVNSKKSQQQKKQVDRKASKGRKIRFAVQPKLVNFVVPEKHSAYDENSDSNVVTRDGSTINLDNLVRSLFRATTA
eukprot:gb/GECG01006998.1/.p1 GENE.gb/GECG01006998.1/~~gb/GECG01006998.1/.p1  ORF type:complete len:546 (+),score=123.41 gb/GECG01006998.1/:1-1638(+)